MDEKIVGKIIYKNASVIMCLLIAMFCFSGSSIAAMPEAELFEKAYEYYLATDPEKALETFDLFLQHFPQSSALDSVLFWRAKSLMQLKRVDEAATGFRKLRDLFPESSYSVFAEKELETLKSRQQKVVKSDAAREKTVTISDANMPGCEDRMRKLEAEKIDLERQLPDAEQKRQLAEKGLSKVLDEKNSLETQLAELKKDRDNLDVLAEEVKKLRGEATLSSAETDRLRRENSKLLDDWRKNDASLRERDQSLSQAQEAIALLEKTFKGSEQEKAKQVQELSDRNRAGDSEKKALQEELDREKKRVAELSGKAKERDAALTDELKLLERSRQDLEARLAAEKAEKQSESQKLQTDRDELQKQLQEVEARTGKAKDALSQLEDSRKKQEELSARLDEMKRSLSEAQFRSVQSDKLDLANRILLDEKRQLQTQVKEYEEKIAALSSQQDKHIAFDRERKELTARFEEQEKKIKDQESQGSGLKTEKEAMERKLKEAQEALAALKGAKEDQVLLLAEVDQLKTKTQQMQTELADIKKVNEQHATRNAELARDVSDLRARSLDFEKPFLRIGKDHYSLLAIMSEGRTARNVTDKIQVKNVPWRTGNIIDVFMAEQILARKAQEETLSADTAVKESLVKRYALSADEGAYLTKYLAIDSLIKKRISSPAITEKEAREYYDRHKDQYIHGRENRIRVLSVKYGKTDELDKSLIAVEMQQEAQEGRPFDAIARKRSAVAVMKEMSLSRLPDWARVKLAGLKEGEVSNIISADNEFMIVQPIPSRPVFRSFEEVRKEIEKKLSAEQPRQKESFTEWVDSLKKDAEFLIY